MFCMQTMKQGLHSPEDATVTILKRLCSILHLPDVENCSFSDTGLLKKIVREGLNPKDFFFRRIFSDCFSNEKDDIVYFLRQVLCFCLLHPDFGHVVEEVAPGSMVILIPWLAVQISVQTDEDVCGLFYILLSRVSGNPLLMSIAQTYLFSPNVLLTLHECMKTWCKQARDQTTTVDMVKILLSYSFQALLVALRINEYSLKEHFSLMYPFVSLGFSILQENEFNNVNELRLSTFAYVCVALEMSSQQIEELVDQLQLKQTLSCLFISTQQHSIMDVCGGFQAYNDFVEKNEKFPLFVQHCQKIAIEVEQEKKKSVDKGSKKPIKQSDAQMKTKRKCTNALPNFYFLMALNTETPDAVTKLLSHSSCVPFSEYGNNTLNLWCPISRSVNTKEEELAKEPPRSLRLIEMTILSVLGKRATVLVGKSGTGKSYTLTLVDTILRNKMNVTKDSPLCDQDGLLWLYLDDETDPRTLIGAWETGSEPCSFVWKDGVLVRAMKSGRWVIIENIDRCSSDILETMREVVEFRKITIVERSKTVRAHENFRLFGTVTINNRNSTSHCSQALTQLPQSLQSWKSIVCPEFTKEDILFVAFKNFFSLRSIVSLLYDAFYVVATLDWIQISSDLRQHFSNAMFFKYLHHIESRFLNIAIVLPLLESHKFILIEEFYHTVALSYPYKEFRNVVCEKFSEVLGVSWPQTADILKEKQSVFIENHFLRVGSIAVACNSPSQYSVQSREQESFHFTSIHAKVMRSMVAAYLHKESVLLVGSTGSGKTSLVQKFASLIYQEISVYNFNDQSESCDLIGRIVQQDLSSLIGTFNETLIQLIHETTFIKESQKKDLCANVLLLYSLGKWKPYLSFVRNMTSRMQKNVAKTPNLNDQAVLQHKWSQLAGKLGKLEANPLLQSVTSTQQCVSLHSAKFLFEEGPLVTAMRKGQWIVLDEINLAPSDVLQRLKGLLTYSQGTKAGPSPFVLTENSGEEIIPHDNFRIFACMNPSLEIHEYQFSQSLKNPSKDVSPLIPTMKSSTGKKDLASDIRGCFSEFYVDEVTDVNDVTAIIQQILPLCDRNLAENVATFYLHARSLCSTYQIATGLGTTPHFSLRTLTRALKFAGSVMKQRWKTQNAKAALMNGIIANFMTGLKEASFTLMISILSEKLGLNKSTLAQMCHYKKQTNETNCYENCNSLVYAIETKDTPTNQFLLLKEDMCLPSKYALAESNSSLTTLVENLPLNKYVNSFKKHASAKDQIHRWVTVEGFPIRCGPEIIDLYTAYKNLIVTPSVRFTIERIARVLSGSRVPILLEGPTSCGKSSIVKFICQITGHRFVRINNHDHTDVQEYLGQHVVDSVTGKLVFVEGIIAQAARQGHWIILDELNLAPSEVLECLNRLLDGNRELFIPETGVTISAHEDFVIFATQNPAGGVYGGRKPLSQAFRNRFIEIACEELPTEELNIILQKRCELPLSFTNAMVNVYKELKARRLKASVFESSSSFMTIRDLLRWGFRQPENNQALSYEGYFLIGERLRDPEEKRVLLDILQNKCLKGKHIMELHYNFHTDPFVIQTQKELIKLSKKQINISLTHSMTRLIALVKRAICHNEPILLVGETGTGKTSVCQLLATLADIPLRIVNCHQQTESADLLGSLQPVKDRLKFFHAVKEKNQKLIYLVDSYVASIQETQGLHLVEIKAILNDMIEMLHKKIPEDANACDEKEKKESHYFFSDMLNDEIFSDIKENLLRAQIQLLHFKIGLANNSCERKIPLLKSSLQKQSVEPDTLSVDMKKRQYVDTSHIDAHVDETCNGQLLKRLKVNEIYYDVSLVETFQEFLKSLGVSISDLLSSLQQCRSLFQWEDGPLVKCMKDGTYLLLDEISLADDAVLERLNSVLEHERSLVLTEKGCLFQTIPSDSNCLVEQTGIEIVKAKPTFRIFATMNPGGDFGKRELSPALRNRFTEIWVPAVTFDSADMFNLIFEIFSHKIHSNESSIHLHCLDSNFIKLVALILQKTVCWYNNHVEYLLSVREVLSWIDFILSFSNRLISCHHAATNISVENTIIHALFHGAFLTCIDAFGIGNRVCHKFHHQETTVGVSNMNRSAFGDALLHFMVTCISENIPTFSKETLNWFVGQFKEEGFAWLNQVLNERSIPIVSLNSETYLKFGDFFLRTLERFPTDNNKINSLSIKCDFNFSTPTTIINLGRIIRALQLSRAILLEGSPGAGKTSIVQSLAVLTGNQLIRINLSEFTDLSDLLGSDLPCATRISLYGEDKIFDEKYLELEMKHQTNAFHWVDGILINAMTKGYWVLLDELNLASQQVLEGLNALLDHRRKVYIPELDRLVHCAPTFRLFAAQNPMADGGGRRGIPRSFLNRFSRISVDNLTDEDFEKIAFFTFDKGHTSTKEHTTTLCKNVIKTIQAVKTENSSNPFTGSTSWEFNLRDVFRVLQLLKMHQSLDDLKEAASVVLLSRLCTTEDGYRALKAISETLHSFSVDWSRIFLCKVFLVQQELECFSNSVVCDKKKVFLSYERNNDNVSYNAYVAKLKTFIFSQREKVIIGRLCFNRQRNTCVHKLSDTKYSVGLLKSQENVLSRIAYGIAYNWPVLITGPPGSGKSSVVHTLANLCSTKLHMFRMTEFFDVSELLGVYEPETITDIINMLRQKLGCLIQSISECHHFMNSLTHIGNLLEQLATLLSFEDDVFLQKFLQNPTSVSMQDVDFSFKFLKEFETLNSHCGDTDKKKSTSQIIVAIRRLIKILNLKAKEDKDTLRFRWTDGLLVQCVEQGDWILFQHVHLASPAFLDRLNSLLEPNGFLFLTECGESCVIRPHPNFRLFFTLDSSCTIPHRVSKALRNRCLEVNMTTLNRTDVVTLLPPSNKPIHSPNQTPNVNYVFIKQWCDVPYLLRHLLLEISTRALDDSTATPTVSERVQCCLRYFQCFLDLHPDLLDVNGPISSYLVDIHEKYQFACCGRVKKLRFADTRLLAVLLSFVVSLFFYSFSFLDETSSNCFNKSTVCSWYPLWKDLNDENKCVLCKLSQAVLEEGFDQFQKKTLSKQLFQEWMVAAAITSHVRTNVDHLYLYDTFCETCTFSWFPTLPIDYRCVLFEAIRLTYCQLLERVGSSKWNTLLSILDSSNTMLEPPLRCPSGTGIFSPMSNIIQVVENSTLKQCYFKSRIFRHVLHQATTHWDASDCQTRYYFHQLIIQSLKSYFENFLPNDFSLACQFIRIYLSQQALVPSILIAHIEQYIGCLTFYEGFFIELDHALQQYYASLSNAPSTNSPPLHCFQATFEEYSNKRFLRDIPTSHSQPSVTENFKIESFKLLTQLYKTSLRILPFLPSFFDSSYHTREDELSESYSVTVLHKVTPVSLWDIRGWVEDSDSHGNIWLSHFKAPMQLNRRDTERFLMSTWVWGPHEAQHYFNFVRQYVASILNKTVEPEHLPLLSQIAGFLDHLLCLCEEQSFHCLFCGDKSVPLCPNKDTAGFQERIHSLLLRRLKHIETTLLQKGIPQRLYTMKDTIGVSFKLEPFQKAFGSHMALKRSLPLTTWLQDTLSSVQIKNSYSNAQEFLLDFSLQKFLQAGLLDDNTKDFPSFLELCTNIIYLKAIVQCINFKQNKSSQGKVSLHIILDRIWEHISHQCENGIAKLHTRQFSPLVETCTNKSNTVSDVFVILYFSSLFQLFGEKVQSLLNYGLVQTSVEQLLKESCATLRLCKKFLLERVVYILQQVSSHCRRLISSTTFDTVAHFVSLVWQMESDMAPSDSSCYITLLSRCSISCFVTSRNLLEVVFYEFMTSSSTLSQTCSNILTVQDFLLVNGKYILSLCTAQTYLPDQLSTGPKSLKLKLAALDPENFTAWRSALILNFCSQIDLSVTLAQVQNLSEKVSLLQHLLSCEDSIFLAFSNQTLKSPHTCPENSMCRYWSNYICTGLKEVLMRFQCCVDPKQRGANMDPCQSENFMIFQRYTCLCCHDQFLLKDLFQIVSRTLSCLEMHHKSLQTRFECDQFLQNPIVRKLLKLLLVFIKKRCEDVSACSLSATTISSCRSTELKSYSTDPWSAIVCQFIWHLSLCRIVTYSSQLSVQLEQEILLQQTLQYSQYHLDSLEFEILFENATTCVEQAAHSIPSIHQRYLTMEKNDVQDFAQRVAEKLPFRPPIEPRSLSESETNMYNRLCDTQLLEPLTASTTTQMDQLQKEVSDFVSSTWNERVLEKRLQFMFDTPPQKTQGMYYFGKKEEENVLESVSFLTNTTLLFCKTIQESYVLFPEITTAVAICFKVALYSVLKYVSDFFLPSKRHMTGLSVVETSTLGFFSRALDHQPFESLNSTKSHPSCQPLSFHSEKHHVDYLLWLCTAYEYALQHNTFFNVNMKAFQHYVFQLCSYYQEDYEKKEKQDAAKFASYIQEQNPSCMDLSKQKETDEDRDKRIALSFFPLGSFSSEDCMNEKTPVYDRVLESHCVTPVVEFIEKPVNTENSNVPVACCLTNEFCFKSHQLDRFMRFFHDLSNTLHLRSIQAQKFHFSRVPCYSSYLSSVNIVFNHPNASTYCVSFFEEDLLRTTLGYTLVPYKNDVLPKTFESLAPFSMNSLLVHALLTYHGLQLQHALKVNAIRSDYNALFQKELMDSSFISSPSQTCDISENNIQTKPVPLETNEHTTYRSRKIKFQRIQRLLRATPGARFSSNNSLPASSFYKDAWPAASVGAYPLLTKIKHDATRFLVECPEHPVLYDIIQMIDTFTNLPVFTTTAVSLMNVLQLVISRCEKWEAFAHRQISLKESTTKLTQYLFLLRNHQLCDWRELRNQREEHFSLSVASWAPQLIEFLSQLIHEMLEQIHPQLSPNCENTKHSLQAQSSLFSKSHVQLLWSYLEQNIFPKPLGEFDARLNIIMMVSFFYKDKSSFCENQVANVLKHFVLYAELVKDKADKSMGIGRKTLDKKIHSLLTTTAWDFSKPDTLNYSVQKAHHQLAKAITEFDNYLQTPLLEFIAHISIPESLRSNNVHMDHQEKTLLSMSTSNYSWLENLLTHVIPSTGSLVIKTNSLPKTAISTQPDCLSLWITQLTGNICDTSIEPLYQTFLTEWLLTLHQDIQNVLHLLETSDSSHKKYWCTDLNQRLKKVNLSFVTGNTDLSFVITDVGLPSIGSSTHLLLGIPCIPEISKNFILYSKTLPETQTSNDFLASLLYNCARPTDSIQSFSELLDCIPKLWKHVQTSLYRQVRQYTVLSGQRSSCHADLLNDNSHSVWYTHCCILLEATQKYVCQLWNISQQLTEFLDLLHLASRPSYSVPCETFRSFFVDFDSFYEALRQFLFFTQTPHSSSKEPVTRIADSNSSSNQLSVEQHLFPTCVSPNFQHATTLSTPSLFDRSSESAKPLNVSFTMRVLQIFKATFELFPEFRVFQRDPTITFVSEQSRSILLKILHFINDVIQICENVENFKVQANPSFVNAIMSTQNVPLCQKHALIAILNTFCKSLTRLLQCIPDPVLKVISLEYNTTFAPYQGSSMSAPLAQSVVLEATPDVKDEHLVDVSLQFRQSCSLDFSKIIHFLKKNYFSAVILRDSPLQIPQMHFMENHEYLKNAAMIGLTLFLSTLDTAVGLAGSGVLTLKISTVLFKEGYCSDRNSLQEDLGNQQSHANQELLGGTGIGEGDGINDHTNDIMDSDLLDGYKHEEQEHPEEKKNDEDNQKDSFSEIIDAMQPTLTKPEDHTEDESNECGPDKELGDVPMNEGEMENKKKENDIENEDPSDDSDSKKKNDHIETENASTIEESLELAAQQEEKPNQDSTQPETNAAHQQDSNETPDEVNTDNVSESDYSQDLEQDAYHFQSQNEKKNENLQDEDDINMDSDIDMDESEGKEPFEDNVSLSDADDNISETDKTDNMDDNPIESPNQDQDSCDENALESKTDLSANVPEDESESQAIQQDDQSFTNNKQSNQKRGQNSNNENGVKNTTVEENNNDESNSCSELQVPDDKDEMDDKTATHELTLSGESKAEATDLTAQEAAPQSCCYDNQRHFNDESIPNPLLPENEQALNQWMKRVTLDKETMHSMSEEEKEASYDEVKSGAECQEDKNSLLKGLAQTENVSNVNNTDDVNEADREDNTLHQMGLEKMSETEKTKQSVTKEHIPRKLEKCSSKNCSDDLKRQEKEKSFSVLEDNIAQPSIEETNEIVDDTNIDMHPQSLSAYKTQNWTRHEHTTDANTETASETDATDNSKPMSQQLAKEFWELYGRETDSSATRLCEQLRIVLEPTLKGRFSDGFRTGKRLSMRKVVAFIASNFRRDKIWLRRTRPSRRDYRILIALDNTRSMSYCSVGQKSLKAIITVCTAFQRLELGETGLCAFGGSTPQIILPLKETAYNEDTGTKIIQSFTFDKESFMSYDRALPDLFNLAFKTFSEVAVTQNTSALQQMLLILSDGRFNKRAVYGKIHEALTCHIIPIFLIIDPFHNSENNGKRVSMTTSQSIYDLKEASWNNDNLHVKNYLDDFPFPFYAVIQSISSIPDVLTDIVRQWIELLN